MIWYDPDPDDDAPPSDVEDDLDVDVRSNPDTEEEIADDPRIDTGRPAMD